MKKLVALAVVAAVLALVVALPSVALADPPSAMAHGRGTFEPIGDKITGVKLNIMASAEGKLVRSDIQFQKDGVWRKAAYKKMKLWEEDGVTYLSVGEFLIMDAGPGKKDVIYAGGEKAEFTTGNVVISGSYSSSLPIIIK